MAPIEGKVLAGEGKLVLRRGRVQYALPLMSKAFAFASRALQGYKAHTEGKEQAVAIVEREVAAVEERGLNFVGSEVSKYV